MKTKQFNHPLNIPRIGTHMVRMAKKAIRIIQAECHEIVAEQKPAYDGLKYDCATNGDKKAQAMYIKEITRHFPTFGVIAEEKELTIPCTDPRGDIYFTVDPLDGTKAYERKQSHGVGTMIALVCNGKVIAAVVGDANTGEIYTYADTEPQGTADRHRFGKVSNLTPELKPLTMQYILLRDAPKNQPDVITRMVRDVTDGGLFKDIEVSGGSIGTCFARLWKGEIGAIVLSKDRYDTPWDLAPILGISNRLGFKFLAIDPTGKLLPYEPHPVKTVVKKTYAEIIVHEAHLDEVRKWLERN